MTSPILYIVHALQAGFSFYNLYLCSISITNFQQYEEKSEKAAQYSNTAAEQLHKTRTTQTSSALTVCPRLSGMHIELDNSKQILFFYALYEHTF